LVAAYFSWRWVEKPFRAAQPIAVVTLASIVSVLIIGAAVVIRVSGGLPGRYDPQVIAADAMLDYKWPLRIHRCFLTSADGFDDFDRLACLYERTDEPNVLLIGDSHAAHLWYGLLDRFARTNVMQANASGCRPLVGDQANAAVRCTSLMHWIYNDYLSYHRPDLIILSGLWRPDDTSGLARTLLWLKERHYNVLVAGPSPIWDMPVPKLIAIAMERGDPRLVDLHRLESTYELDSCFAAIALTHDAKYFSVLQTLCPSECQVVGTNGVPLIFDESHLTAEASELIAAKFQDESLRPE
jgi:hypothetical protein